MKIFQALVLLTSIFYLSSCDKFKVTTTATGEKIQVHKKGEGNKLAKENDIITFDLEIKTAKDSVLKSSYKEGAPYTIPLQKGAFKGSFENALFHIGMGDSTTVFVSSDSLFKLMGQGNPPGVDKGSDLKFIVNVRKVQTRADFDKEVIDKKAAEPKSIEAYATKNLKNAQKTVDGIFYAPITEGTGPNITNGKTVGVQYVGKFLDGKIFDQSTPQSPFSLVVGAGSVIPGWEKALLTMKKGGKSTFIIPSALAYGEQGGGPIGPNTPLVFDITVTDVK